MTNSMNIAKLSLEVTSEANAYAYFERLRWNGAPKCAHCESSNVYFIEPANGVSRCHPHGYPKPASCVALP